MTGYGLAAQVHDSQGQPEKPHCPTCDDSGKVEVAVIVYLNADGDPVHWPHKDLKPVVEVPCPICRSAFIV